MHAATACKTALGVPAEDDDGNAASKTTGEVKKVPSVVQSALMGEAWNKEKVDKVVAAIRQHLEGDNEYGVFEETESLESVEKLAVWAALDSRERARIKKIEAEHRKGSAQVVIAGKH